MSSVKTEARGKPGFAKTYLQIPMSLTSKYLFPFGMIGTFIRPAICNVKCRIELF